MIVFTAPLIAILCSERALNAYSYQHAAQMVDRRSATCMDGYDSPDQQNHRDAKRQPRPPRHICFGAVHVQNCPSPKGHPGWPPCQIM